MAVRGLFETHLTVTDLAAASAFYRDIVGLPVALEVPERGATFHWIGGPGRAMLGLPPANLVYPPLIGEHSVTLYNGLPAADVPVVSAGDGAVR